MLELHTEPMQKNGMGMSPVQGDTNLIQGSISPMQGGMTPMQTSQSNMALIPQRPDHIMLRQEGIETTEDPAGRRDVTNSSIRGLLARNLG